MQRHGQEEASRLRGMDIEAILNRSGAILFLWRNDPQWSIQYVSDNVALFGYDPKALMEQHQPYGRLIHPADREAVHKAMAAWLEEGRHAYRLHYRLCTAEGAVRWVDEHGLILRDAAGFAEAVQGVVLDVTERHEAEEQLQAYRTRLEAMVDERTRALEEANRRLREDFSQRREAETARLAMEREVMAARERELLEQADRLSALGFLATGVAHEVNNPLQGMLSHLQAVRRALPNGFRRADSIAAVERGIESIAALVRRLLWLGSGANADDAPARLSDALAFVRELLEPQLRRSGITLAIQRSPTDAAVAMPSREIVQVLLNLLLNARDAMPEGGTVTVACSVLGDLALITVSDTGSGIEPGIQARIFTPFFTTKGARGTGLGLSVAASLVQARQGNISVESEPGKGARFTVRIPVAGGKKENDHETVCPDRR